MINYDNIAARFRTLGLYDNDGVNTQIILDAALKDDLRLLVCILAEELGHHFTSIGRSFYKAANCPFWKLNHIKTEMRALKWSAFHLMPEEKLRYAITREKLRQIYEFEEYFFVTEELARFRLNFCDMPPLWKKNSKLARLEKAGQLRLFN
jgi:hypothetical protein